MNTLLEFIIISGISFFLFMFIGYKDAIRTKSPSGPVSKLFDKFSFWKAYDENGIRGLLYRQNFLFKLMASLAGALIIRVLYAVFFDFSIASELFNMLTGVSGFLLHALVILLGIYLSYLWPQVKSKAKEVTQGAYKDDTEKKNQQIESSQVKESTIIKPEPQPETPKEPTGKQKPGDIIDDYLK